MKLLWPLIIALISTSAFPWQEGLKREIEKIDREFQGEVGVVIKNLKDGSKLAYNAEGKWYLSSTMKLIVAISLLEEVESERVALDQKVTLKSSDFVDGAGPLLWSKPGQQFTVGHLLKLMLRESDNTAADMLIELLGVEELNKDFKKWMPEAGEATSLLTVRYLGYGELHPKARSLNNMDFILLKNEPQNNRHAAFAKKIQVPTKELKARSYAEAFEKYYAKEYNSASLHSYVGLLEKLEKGQLLSKANTKLVLEHMEHMTTGEHRLKAGLPQNFKFMQKTGTQVHRACNVGLIERSSTTGSEVALAVCIKKPSESIDSDQIFKKIGQELGRSSLFSAQD